MLAFGIILSLIPLAKLPFGGSITACSMLPIILIAYRHGTGWGLFTGFAFSLLQLLLGMNNLSYATSIWAAIAIILLDYVVAFTLLGLAGSFRKYISSQAGALVAGTALVCVLRYALHVISGCTVWAGVSIPTSDGLLYSLAYNATYMLPETLITIVGAVFISRVLDFRNETITRVVVKSKAPRAAVVLSIVSAAVLAAAAIFDIQRIFTAIQAESGFDITKLASVDWALLAIITLPALLFAGVLFAISKRIEKNQPSDKT